MNLTNISKEEIEKIFDFAYKRADLILQGSKVGLRNDTETKEAKDIVTMITRIRRS